MAKETMLQQLNPNLITAAAGLVGAGIGGASTYLANRLQWRRESRRTVYANLISAAYGIEPLIASELTEAQGRIKNGNGVADPRAEFYLQLDSAALLANWNTQSALQKWRELSLGLGRLNQMTHEERASFRANWSKRQNEFYECARAELGAQGTFSNRRAMMGYLLIAFVCLAAVAGIEDPKPVSVRMLFATWALLAVSSILLYMAFRAARRWKNTKRRLTQIMNAQGKISGFQYLKTFDVVQIGIILAFGCNILAIFQILSTDFSDSGAFAGWGAVALIVFGIAQFITSIEASENLFPPAD